MGSTILTRHHDRLPFLILISIFCCNQYNRATAFAPFPLVFTPSICQHSIPSKHSKAFSCYPQRHQQNQHLRYSVTLFQNNKGDLKDATPLSPPITVGTIIESLTPLVDKIKASLSNIDISSAIQNTISTSPGLEIGSRGEIYVAIQAGLVLAILFGNIPFLGKLVSFLLGPTLFLLGLAICLLGVSELGSSLSPWPVPANSGDELVKDGLIFKEVRHPIYAGLLCVMTGFSVWTGSVMRLVLTLGLFILLDIKSDYEEEGLVEKFGQDYIKYRTEVPGKFLPERIVKTLDRFRKRKCN